MSDALVLIDAGGANIGSVQAAFARLGVAAPLTTDPARIRAAARVVLPGVGAAARAMQRLRETALDQLVPRLTQPVLGICVGMQVLYEGSDEGDAPGLGVFAGRLARIAAAPGVRVPHMGWNQILPRHAAPLLAGFGAADHAYFVHSYHFRVTDPAHRLAFCDYGGPITAIVGRDNILGTQFHPEKSQAAGLHLIGNFLRWTP